MKIIFTFFLTIFSLNTFSEVDWSICKDYLSKASSYEKSSTGLPNYMLNNLLVFNKDDLDMLRPEKGTNIIKVPNGTKAVVSIQDFSRKNQFTTKFLLRDYALPENNNQKSERTDSDLNKYPVVEVKVVRTPGERGDIYNVKLEATQLIDVVKNNENKTISFGVSKDGFNIRTRVTFEIYNNKCYISELYDFPDPLRRDNRMPMSFDTKKCVQLKRALKKSPSSEQCRAIYEIHAKNIMELSNEDHITFLNRDCDHIIYAIDNYLGSKAFWRDDMPFTIDHYSKEAYTHLIEKNERIGKCLAPEKLSDLTAPSVKFLIESIEADEIKKSNETKMKPSAVSR